MVVFAALTFYSCFLRQVQGDDFSISWAMLGSGWLAQVSKFRGGGSSPDLARMVLDVGTGLGGWD